jgi:hypothetical protein
MTDSDCYQSRHKGQLHISPGNLLLPNLHFNLPHIEISKIESVLIMMLMAARFGSDSFFKYAMIVY